MPDSYLLTESELNQWEKWFKENPHETREDLEKMMELHPHETAEDRLFWSKLLEANYRIIERKKQRKLASRRTLIERWLTDDA